MQSTKTHFLKDLYANTLFLFLKKGTNITEGMKINKCDSPKLPCDYVICSFLLHLGWKQREAWIQSLNRYDPRSANSKVVRPEHHALCEREAIDLAKSLFISEAARLFIHLVTSISCRCLGRGAVEPALRLRFFMAVLCYRIADGVR